MRSTTETGNVADFCPDGTVTEPGTVTNAVFVLWRVRTAPPDGAALSRLTTQVVLPSPEVVGGPETDATDHPLSLYAATKKAGEAMTHAYAHVWGIPTTAFRFFTVYGPWGRPDMALFSFAEAILEGRAIELFNEGRMERDFTYIDDLVEAVVRLAPLAPELGRPMGPADSLSPGAPWRAVNIGGGTPVPLMEFLGILEGALGRRAQVAYAPMQAGDMASTFAAADLLEALTGFRPSTPASVGVPAFCDWLLAYRADPDGVCARAAAALQA